MKPRGCNLWVDLIVVCIPFVTAGMACYPMGSLSTSKSLYVALHGSDWHSGRNEGAPLATIQCALDRARPGDQIVVESGTYHERLHVRKGGTEAAPICIKAKSPGHVIITGALPGGVPHDWIWRDEGHGIFSTATTAPVYRLNDNEATCFRLPWGGLANLRKLAAKPGAWSAFCEEDGRLYVALKGGRNPSQHDLRTHRPAPAPREWGEFHSAIIWIEADHVRLEGLQIDFGIGAAVRVWNASDAELHDCVFTGASFGVKCGGGTKPCRNIRLKNCLYHNFPQYHWHKDWLSWDDVYAGYASSTLVSSTDTPLTVQNCMTTHAGDALRISPHAGQGPKAAIIEGNQIAFCTDDAIEFDGDGAHVSVENNLVYEAHQNLAFSPVAAGPISVRHNLFVHSPQGINGSQIKLINNLPGQRIRNVMVRENVFIGNWLCWYSTGSIEQILIEQNRFYVRQQADPPWPSRGVTVRENQVVIQTAPGLPENTVAEYYRNESAARWIRNILDRDAGPAWLRSEQHFATKEAILWKVRLRQLLQSAEVP